MASSSREVHSTRRRFIGPMPAATLSQEPNGKRPHMKKRRAPRDQDDSLASSSDDDSDRTSLSDVIRRHALEYFLKHGGNPDNWGDSQQKSVRAEMRKRWREGEWNRARKQQKQGGTLPKWIGTSFDIGVFLGVDILDRNLPTASQGGSARPSTSTDAECTNPAIHVTSSSGEREPFVTAPSHINNSIPNDAEDGLESPSPPVDHEQVSSKPPSASSSMALLPSPSDDASRNIRVDLDVSAKAIAPTSHAKAHAAAVSNSAAPDTHSPMKGKRKGKGKGKDIHVHYDDDAPASPSEVLARTGSAMKVTSAGAAEQAISEASILWGDVIMRDRMLVRISYTEDTVPASFDERQNRITRHLDNEEWAEYIVAWRKDRLELYREPRTPGKEWFTGTKRLAYIVPLGSSTTRLSLYCFVDLTFCLTCPSAPLQVYSRRRRHLFGSARGTNIFVFKLKCRTRAVDWVWHIWRHMGGQLPPYIELRSPALETRIKVDVPGFDTVDIDAAYNVFRRGNIIRLCEKYLSAAPEYHFMMEREREEGATFELAWRLDTDLDWVWQEDDVQGKARKWAVLFGLALKQGDKPAHLEFRMKQHVPTRLHTKDGTRLDEPPAVEGYLDRIRPNSQLKQSLYLATHDGYLFWLLPARAHQPPPPGASVDAPLAPRSALSATSPSVDTGRRAEVRRGSLQVLDAMSVTDLRSIVAVRRAFQLVPQNRAQSEPLDSAGWEDTADFWEQVERSGSDDEDEGGDVSMARTKDKTRLKMHRSFELLLTSGRVVRLEAYSCATALEWIVRLRPLISYWKKRHQIDSRREMDIAHFSTGRERITPHRTRNEHLHGARETPAEPPPDRDASLPDLTFFYNWCVLEGCRPILKSGRLHVRKPWWGQYKHIQLVLISGHLVQYLITNHSSLNHHRDKVINLLDAYVCSGYFAAQYLPEGQYDANAAPVARRYQDGLETNDHEEDTLFIIWYCNVRGAAPGVRRNNSGADVPALNAKRKVAVFRTRSKLERDSWVWAINVEIEKVVRASKDREETVRQAGGLAET